MDFKFIKDLFHIEQNVGYSIDELNTVIEKWHGMPDVLKEYYVQLGKHNTLNFSQNLLCEPERLIDAKNYIIFYKENQYAAQWAIRKEDWHKNNPPVYCSIDEKNFELETDSLSEFLNAMALFQASFGLEYCCEDIFIVSEEQANQLKERYKKYPYELKQWMHIGFYGNNTDEVIYLGENSDYDLIYASESQEHFMQMKEVLDTLDLEEY